MRMTCCQAGTATPGPGMIFLFSRIFPLPFVLIGAALLFFGSRSVSHARASSTWPVAEGVITAAEVVRRSGSGDSGPTYRPDISYDYTVDGVTRHGDRIYFGGAVSTSNRGWARGIVERYPVGRQVTVHYSPDDPALAVLEPGMTWVVWMMPGIGAVLFLVGVVMMVAMPRLMGRMTGRTVAESKIEAPPDGQDRGFVDEENPFRDR